MKNFLIFLSLIIAIPFLAQDVKSEIEFQFRDYSDLLINKKFEKALDTYANEDFLKIVPKNQLVEIMNEMFNSPEIEVKIEQPKNIIINDKIIEEKENKFVGLGYEQIIQMKFNGNEINQKDLLSALKNEFGSENVNFNEQTNFFIINTNKIVVANSSNAKNWKFTVLEKKQIPILIQFIPEQFLKNLK